MQTKFYQSRTIITIKTISRKVVKRIPYSFVFLLFSFFGFTFIEVHCACRLTLRQSSFLINTLDSFVNVCHYD